MKNTDKEVCFRVATDADLSAAWCVVDDARNDMLAIGRKQWTAEYPSARNIRADISAGHAYVLVCDGEIVAYGAVAADGEPEYQHIIGAWLTDGHYVVVHRLAVSPRHRGKSLAKSFFDGVARLCTAHDIHSIKVDTNYDNVQMLSILPHMGFVRCGEIDYHGHGMRIAFEKVI